MTKAATAALRTLPSLLIVSPCVIFFIIPSGLFESQSNQRRYACARWKGRAASSVIARSTCDGAIHSSIAGGMDSVGPLAMTRKQQLLLPLPFTAHEIEVAAF